MRPYWGDPYELLLEGEVDPTWPDAVEAAVGNKSRPVIVTIDSGGGDIQSALAAASMLERHRAEVTTIVPAGAQCLSAATSVFAAGRVRRAHVSSTFLIHAAAIAPERWTAAAHRAAAASLTSLDDALFQHLAIRCGCPMAEIEAAVREIPMTAMDAQNLGLVHDVEW